MKASSSLRQAAVLGLALTLPAAAGCASRAAPFNDLDQAQVTILKLQGQQTPAPGMPGTQPGQFPTLPIPGLTPEQQAQLQQGAQQLGQAVGQMIPGLPIPGLPGATPVQQPQQTFNGFVVLGSTPVADEDTKSKLLDIFGHEDSFNRNVGPCFTPGMGVVFSDPTKGNIELMVSFSCNQVQGNGFRWPHQANGMTPDTSNQLRMIYQQMFMQPPPMQGG